MKKIYYLYSLLALFFFSLSKAQIVNIPDYYFKSRVVSANATTNFNAKNLAGNYFKVDANNDGEIQVSEAQQVSALYIGGLGISSLEGISGFSNLKLLSCQTNNLIHVNLQGLQNLESVDLNNQSSPTGIGGILSLTIQGSPNLKFLNCSYNKISSLNIQEFLNLKNLNCSYNQLTSLNTQGLNGLEEIKCRNNDQITSLNIQGLNSLKYLDFGYTKISSLNFQGFNNLQQLICDGSLLTSLDLSGLASLNYLNTDNTSTNSINVQGCTNLEIMYCNNNYLLNTLNIDGCINLKTLKISETDLISLNVNHCTSLQILSAVNNYLLKSLFIKNGKNELLTLTNNNLSYICCDDSQLASLQSFISQGCSVNSYCSFTPGGVYYTIQGQSKLDLNTNGCDPNDGIFPNLKYSITNGTITGHLISDGSGNYSIPVEAGTHIITPVLENPTYFTATPANVSASFPATPSPLVQNFCIVPNGTHNDLEITLLPISPAIPGFSTTKYKLIYKNKGNQPLSGSVEYLYDESRMDFISAAQTVSSQTSGSLVWNYTNLIPFESRSIEVIMRVNAPTDNPAVTVGDILHLQAKINPVISDELPLDNISSLHQTAVSSYDPNDKTCIEGNTITPAMVGNDVHYLIRFENTGNYFAENIVVKDMIDTDKFDISSLQITDTSHLCRAHITNGNKVEFIFENIDLPATPSPDRHGYVAFKIKTKSNLVVGNTFSNNAQIYFDYNLPITTNTATTTIQNAVLGSQEWEHARSEVSVFPNPVKDILNIKTEEKLQSVEIFDMNGRIIQSIISPQKQINVTNLAKGLYIVKIITEKRIQSEHFIKE